MTFFTITLGTIAFGSLTMGYLSCGMNLLEWIIMAVATVILFFPGLVHGVLHIDVPDLRGRRCRHRACGSWSSCCRRPASARTRR